MDTSTHKPSSQFACISSIYINKASCASPSLVLLEKYSLPFTNILSYNVVSIDGSHCKFQKVSSRDTVQTRLEGAHHAHWKASILYLQYNSCHTQHFSSAQSHHSSPSSPASSAAVSPDDGTTSRRRSSATPCRRQTLIVSKRKQDNNFLSPEDIIVTINRSEEMN